jgi:4-oxalocrotonate tautomerase
MATTVSYRFQGVFMPHLTIQCFPRNLSDAEKRDMAAEMVSVLKKYLGASDDSISISLIEVSQGRWKSDVYDPIIKPSLGQLLKKPGYQY